ncbi:MAG TPA: ArnT family glycosyltransferase [Candidatus Hypogeohydataceae bacterium YC38]
MMKGYLSKEISSKEGFLPFLLAILCLALYLPNLGGRDFWSGRETLYAQVARETLWEGHWFALHYNGEVYCNKPPLYFWFIALLSMPFGDVTPFSLRLPLALSALGTVLVVFYLGKSLFSVRTGFLAGVILASSPQFQKYACVGKLEMLLTFFIASSIAAFYYGLNSTVNKKKYFLWGWLLMALAILTKGLGFLLIPPVILLHLASRRELHRLKETELLLGSILILALMMVWLLPAYIQGGPYYIQGLLGHFEFHLKQTPRYIKPFYYLCEVFVGLLPWTLLLPAFFFYLRKATAEKREGLRLPFLWFAAMFIIFCILLSKKSRYVLTLYPAVALMLACLWDTYIEKASPFWPKIKVVPVVVISLSSGVLMELIASGALSTPTLKGLVAFSFTALGVIIWLALRASQYRVIFLSLFLVITSFEMTYMRLSLPRESNAGIERAVCEEILRVMESGSSLAVYNFAFFNPDYVFYTKTRVRQLSSEEGLTSFFTSEGRAYCLLSEGDYQKIKLFTFKITEVKRGYDGKLILVSNKPNHEEK